MKKITKDDVRGIECKFVVHLPVPDGYDDEYHMVKTRVHLKDGTSFPSTRFIKNFKRPFWITREGHRNHKDKKEHEYLDRVQKFESRQCDLPLSVQKALGQFNKNNDLRKLSASPYLYGSDILSTTIIKNGYMKKNPDLITPYTVAGFDVETDVLHGTERVILATMTMKDKVYTAVVADFAKGFSDFNGLCQRAAEKYIPKLMADRNITWEIEIVKNDFEAVKACFMKAHEWKPDFVEIWNMNFDIPKVVETCERHGVDPKNLFSDPSVPEPYRFFKYKQGPKQKKTASGKVTPIKPADQWHTVFCPASFYIVDGMCVYRKLRVAAGEDPSYSLDAILKKEGFDGKLKFQEADAYTKLAWHVFMQKNYKIEYTVYNIVDCIMMEMLDEKTTDLSFAFPSQVSHSDFSNFKSQPRRTADDLHFFVLEKGMVYGSTGEEMRTELDDDTIGLEEWIITLPAHLVADNGLQCIKEFPSLRTNIRVHVADLDVSASYPNGGVVFNISRATTSKELCQIEGVREITRRQQGINLSGGHTNAMEFCQEMFGMPKMDDVLEAFMEESSSNDAVWIDERKSA